MEQDKLTITASPDVWVEDQDTHELVAAAPPPEAWEPPAWYRGRDVVTHLPNKSAADLVAGRHRMRLEHKPTGVMVTGAAGMTAEFGDLRRTLTAELCERLARRIKEAEAREAEEQARAKAQGGAGKGKR